MHLMTEVEMQKNTGNVHDVSAVFEKRTTAF